MASRQFLRLARGIPLSILHARAPQLTCLTLQRTPFHLCPVTVSRRKLCSNAGFEVINVQDEEDFQKRVLNSDVPVVVDFHAKWCGPCKLLGPRLESIVSKKKGQIQMAKVDVDDHAEIAIQYGVQSVPTVIAVNNGKVQDKFIGLIEDDKITSFLTKLVPQT